LGQQAGRGIANRPGRSDPARGFLAVHRCRVVPRWVARCLRFGVRRGTDWWSCVSSSRGYGDCDGQARCQTSRQSPPCPKRHFRRTGSLGGSPSPASHSHRAFPPRVLPFPCCVGLGRRPKTVRIRLVSPAFWDRRRGDTPPPPPPPPEAPVPTPGETGADAGDDAGAAVVCVTNALKTARRRFAMGAITLSKRLDSPHRAVVLVVGSGTGTCTMRAIQSSLSPPSGSRRAVRASTDGSMPRRKGVSRRKHKARTEPSKATGSTKRSARSVDAGRGEGAGDEAGVSESPPSREGEGGAGDVKAVVEPDEAGRARRGGSTDG
jgi:hypothetical protein